MCNEVLEGGAWWSVVVRDNTNLRTNVIFRCEQIEVRSHSVLATQRDDSTASDAMELD